MAAKTRKKTPVTPDRLMQFGFAYAPPLIIGAAVNSKVFDTLESGPKSIEQVSRNFRGHQVVHMKGSEEKLEVSRSFNHLFKQM